MDTRYSWKNCSLGCVYQNDTIVYPLGMNDTYIEYFYVDVDVSFWQVPQLIILVALFVLIVFGNVCVLVAIGLSHTGMKTRMNFFIVNLAVSDLTVGIFHVIVDFVERCLEVWYGGSVLCKIVRFLQALVVYASTFMIVSLSIDRVDAIARPMNFTRKATTVRVLVNAAWITSGILSIPSFLLFDTYSHTNGKQYCMMNLNETWHWQLYTTLVALTAFIIPALIIVICYSIILFVIWDKGRGFHNSYNGSKCRGKSQSAVEGNKGIIPQAKIKTIKMTLIIVCVFVLSWSPYFVFNLIDVYSNKTKTTTQYAVTSLVQSLAPINSAANPIIYGVFGTSICQNLRRIPCIGYLYKWFCKCRIKRHNFNFRTSHRQSEQTNVDVTSAKYVIVTKRGYRYLVKSNLKHDDTTQQNGQNTLPTSNNTLKNDEAEKTEKCVAHDVVSSPRTQNPSVCHFRRRPSGLPLANRKMTDQETILLETYRSNGKSSVADDNSSLNEDNSLDNKTYCNSQVYNKNRLSGTRQVSGSDDDIMFDKHKMEETVLV